MTWDIICGILRDMNKEIIRLRDLPVRHDPLPPIYRTGEAIVTELVRQYQSLTNVLLHGGPMTIGEQGPWILRYRANRRVLRELLEEFGQRGVTMEIDEVAKKELVERNWKWRQELLDDEIKTSFF